VDSYTNPHRGGRAAYLARRGVGRISYKCPRDVCVRKLEFLFLGMSGREIRFPMRSSMHGGSTVQAPLGSDTFPHTVV
jgi:hypothetical protein